MKSTLLMGDFPDNREQKLNALQMELDIIESFQKIMAKELKALEKTQDNGQNVSKRKLHGHSYRNTA